MKNYLLLPSLTADVDNFTSDFGIKARRAFHRPFRFLVKKGTELAFRCKIQIERYPALEGKKTPYIFASSHGFIEDIPGAVASIDRACYALLGGTDQIEHNPANNATWLSGMIYVNRLDPKSRKDAVLKMERILCSGSSVLLYPEGTWNNTENLLCMPLFAGPWLLAQSTGAKVVPIAQYKDAKNIIHVSVGDPLDLGVMEKAAALRLLRDEIASGLYELLDQYAPHISRSSLGGQCRRDWMEERKSEYLRVKWTRDVWDEEITIYKDKAHPLPAEVLQFTERVELNAQNIGILLPLLARFDEYRSFDFTSYMHQHWQDESIGT